MHHILNQYKLRLTNLSQRNRSLKLGKLSPRKDLDLKDLDFIDKESSEEILLNIIKGKTQPLIRKVDPRNEILSKVESRLNKIYREVNTIFEENGSYDLFVGYPFLEGKFIDGTIVRSPIMLFPVHLERNYQRGTRWKLVSRKNEDVIINKTLFLAYEKFQNHKINEGFWDLNPGNFDDLQDFLNWLYQTLKENDISINFESDLFRFLLDYFPAMNNQRMDLSFKSGILKLKSHAVLGLFPQSDSSLVKDYEYIEANYDDFSIDHFFNPKPAPDIDTWIPEEKRYFITELDQSQEEAILKIKKGKSLIVHGPPGTGKSQVILNIVADAMATGKKVLVVSQKRAALDVVYERIAEKGLARFATIIHDYKGDRSKIFQKIKEQINSIPNFLEDQKDINLSLLEREYRLQSQAVDRHSKNLEELCQALKKTQNCGLNPHQLYLSGTLPETFFPIKPSANYFDFPEMEQFLKRVKTLFEYKDFFEKDNPWYFRQSFHNYRLNQKQEILDSLESTEASLSELSYIFKNLNISHLPLDSSALLGKIEFFNSFYKNLNNPGFKSNYALFLSDKKPVSYFEGKLDSFQKYISSIKSFSFLSNTEILNFSAHEDQIKTYLDNKDSPFRFFNFSYLGAWSHLREIIDQKGMPQEEESYDKLISESSLFKKLVLFYQTVDTVSFFSDFPLTSGIKEMEKWLANKGPILKFAKTLKEKDINIVSPKLDGSVLDESHLLEGKKWTDILSEFQIKLDQYSTRIKSRFHENFNSLLLDGIKNPEKVIGTLQNRKSNLGKDFEDLHSLDSFLHSFSPKEKELFKAIKADFEATSQKNKSSFIENIKNNLIYFWIQIAEDNNPVLAEVSSRSFDSSIIDFQSSLKKRREQILSIIEIKLKEAIVSRIEYNRLKNPITFREIAHQTGKKRQLWSVRKLISNFWEEGLSTLIPCWLASPESVGAVFPMDKQYFDLVVFDEASQCYVESAFPVMLRGKNTVVAGDDKQLQPLDLYSVKLEESESLDSEMALEVESALDLAKNLFEESKLNWHYRSKEEELINFSNHYFYEGRLNIIPPANKGNLDSTPIEWNAIKGLWENKINKEEGVAIIQKLDELLTLENRPSIGIVCFNYHQQEYIKDLLEEKLQEIINEGIPEKTSVYLEVLQSSDEDKSESLFVKNIENVQGDERDIILFSIGYAKNQKGELQSQFGLLNQKGGENRLNVAISRARNKIIVFCSFDPQELRVESSKNEGPKLLKKYLEYAQAVASRNTSLQKNILDSLSHSEEKKTTTPISLLSSKSLPELIGDRLEDLGLKYHTQIGETEYKIDLGILNLEETEYILGIECEGSNYFKGNSAKEREIYRPKMMEKRGWQTHRVWARNYYLSPEKEMKKILDKLKL